MIFSGNANPNLALKTVEFLNMPLGKITAGKFSDGEVMVEVNENVRGRDIYIMQPICAPTNDNLMELLVISDALRRASAERITAVIPYLGYARQDRRTRSSRVPITAKMVANMISSAGIDRVLTVDLHADQIQGFFDIPLDNVYGSPVLLGDIWKHKYPDLMVISPDVGGVVRARALAKRLDDTDLAIIDKRRPNPNESEVMNIIGDVDGILIPGGFGDRGIEGKIQAAHYARSMRIPYFGICLGMQVATIEFARNVCGLEGADTTECNRDTPHPVICLQEEQKGVEDMGATMRLGSCESILFPGTLAAKLYEDSDRINERHRHRYEFNPDYLEQLKKAGLIISSVSAEEELVEIIELADHPFYLGAQFHPEFQSKPNHPHPLFSGFVKAALDSKVVIPA